MNAVASMSIIATAAQSGGIAFPIAIDGLMLRLPFRTGPCVFFDP